MSFISLCVFLSLISAAAQSQPTTPTGIFINCGATVSSVIDGREWLPDAEFVTGGTSKNVTTPGILPILSNVRTFPYARRNAPRKFCYSARVLRNKKYLVRTTYYYGGINGDPSSPPPVFDQIVDGTLWSAVNTTEDYAQGMLSYYEGVFLASGKTMIVCLAANKLTDSDPFISALEILLLEDSLYNSTNFKRFGLGLVARNSFGHNGPVIRFPDDRFDRYWEPFGDNHHVANGADKTAISNFWNLPPLKIFDTGLAVSKPSAMELHWPPGPLPNSTYYIALYIADSRSSSTSISKAFTVNINDITFYHDLNPIPAGSVIFSTQWPLVGSTMVTLTPNNASSVGPVINAGEIFNVLPLERKTLTRDVYTLNSIKTSLQNPPADWLGDPCSPRQYPWRGITCSEGHHIRVVALNLTSMSLSGSLSSSIANLTAVSEIWLGNNSLSGSIPDLSPLKNLEILHLEDNHFSGKLSSSLGGCGKLRELFLQGNNFTGEIPQNLARKSGPKFKSSPGNNFSVPSPA